MMSAPERTWTRVTDAGVGLTDVVYVSQESKAARAIAPGKAALKVVEMVEKEIGRRIVTLNKRVT
jgi:hypothetical protein